MSRRLFDVRTTDDEEYSANRWLVWTVGLTVLAAVTVLRHELERQEPKHDG